MNPENNSGSETPNIDFEGMSDEEQHSLLQARQRAARNIMEDAAENPDANIDREKARQVKAEADAALTNFEIEHGIIPPPEE